jgi:hypothetical protein
MADERLAEPGTERKWTRAEDYFAALARLRTARRTRTEKPRTEPESPRILLSTLPFLALIAGLAVLAVAIMIAAWPGARPQPKPRPAEHEQGVAPKGWLEDAERDFHH